MSLSNLSAEIRSALENELTNPKTPTSTEIPKQMFCNPAKTYSNQQVGLRTRSAHPASYLGMGREGAEPDARATEPILIPSVTLAGARNAPPGRPARRQ